MINMENLNNPFEEKINQLNTDMLKRLILPK